MPAVAKARPLIPLKESEIEFPVIPLDKSLYAGTVQREGVFIATELITVLHKTPVESDLNGVLVVDKRKKISYRDGKFYLGKKEASIKATSESYTVRMLMEGYLQSEGEALSGNVLEELLNRRHIVSKPYLGFVNQFKDAEFSLMETLAENYSNGVLKIENNEWVVLIAVDAVPEGWTFSLAFYDALSIVGSKPFRVGFDSHGRLTFFTTDTAVIIPDMVNEELAGLCTQITLGKADADCGIVISKELDKVMILCGGYYLSITDRIESLLDKKSTSTPVINELATGRCKWQKVKDVKKVKRGGIDLEAVAKCRNLVGLKGERVKVIEGVKGNFST